MKRILIITLMVFVFSTKLYSQTISVLETKQITNSNDGEFYFPHFNNDDSEVIFTKSNYKGLLKKNLDSKEIIQITDENGSGYKPFISEVSDEIIYKSFVIKEGRKFNSLKKYDLNLKTTEIIEQEQRMINLLNQTNASKVGYLVNSSYKTFSFVNTKLSKTNVEPNSLYVESNQLYINQNNAPIILSPLGEGVYVWESFSKDGQNIVFTFGNKGAYICDLEGQILLNIPEAHYPQFSPNGKFILYMIDKDNGTSFTSSDIFVYSIEEEKSYPITNTKDNIEMYAEWSKAGDSIVYHTTSGEIYLTKLEIK
ncbi:MAG: hypothetical protein GY936_01935 [Ignavibacteriae bacterium]|nr:hypothetical protein [Ignavibacteriota bacterium]